MRVMISKSGHRCHEMFGEAEPAYVGDDLRQEFRDQIRVTFDSGSSIKSCTINKKYCITL